MRRLGSIIFLAAMLAPFLASVRWERMSARPLPKVDESPEKTVTSGFVPLGVYRTTDSTTLPSGLPTRGSWVESDEFRGTHETDWYRARSKFQLLLSGYPALAPNRLELELRRDGTTEILRYAGPNPGEAWRTWAVELPNGTTAFRIRATDASSAAYGWLAFSDPFVDVTFVARQLWPLVQLAAVAGLTLALLYGPGLIWLRRGQRTPSDLVVAIVFGPLALAALGLVCWVAGGWVAPATSARIGVAGLLAWVGWGAWQTRDTGAALPRFHGVVIGISALLSAFAVAKANLSVGPAGELFGGTVSRTLAVGGHSDSRTSYHIVQLVAAHAGPFSAEAEAHFSPWSFANRGPLGGLLAAPVVLATGGIASRDACHQPWAPFDRQGFATYRITQIVLASLAAWAVFGAVAALLPATWGLLAAAIVLLAPFFVHELYFTWPKLAAAAFVLLAFVQGHAGRAWRAGLALAVAYLFHPLALLSAPFFLVWLYVREAHRARGRRRLLAPIVFGAALALAVVPWMTSGRLAPLRTGSQTVFFDYFRLSDGKLATDAGPWWVARWSNFANTFVPFYLLNVDRTHESINSVYGPSERPVQLAFLYWNTLPFALGLPAFALLAAAIASACRRAFGAVLLILIGPALLLIFYWGAASTGLMRHCGHVLFVTTIVLGVWALRMHAGGWRRRAIDAFLHPLCFAWRGAEIAVVAFGTTFLHAFPRWAGPLGWNDGATLVVAVGCLLAAVILLAKTAAAAKHELSAVDLPAAPDSS